MATKRRSSKPAASSGDGAGGSGDDQFPLRDSEGRVSVLVELAAAPGVSPVAASASARGIDLSGFDTDEQFSPVPLGSGEVPGGVGTGGPALGFGATASPTTYVVRGRVPDEAAMDELRRRADVLGVWVDTPIAPFARQPISEVQATSPAAGTCPIPPCDCSPGTAHGTIADVANYLGAAQIWAAGFRGAGVVVGVVDGGITAQGRTAKEGETPRRIPRVTGGWPTADWGTEASRWGEHGNMCATDVLGMAPEANVYDLRISGAPDIPSTISRALQAFQWAIDRHRTDGTPHVLSNSWGIFQESWDASYARDPNHPFTRKVVEAIAEGILVLFAAGNCGGTCPDGRCGPDSGPGRSIWGANSHPQVMTVGAVNRDEEFVGYSSEGPGALDPNKPDFCSVTHFAGYHPSDSGTSAATPILAGCVALFKQAYPSATQSEIKDKLKATAKDIGPAGFDQHSGAGIVRIKAAFDAMRPAIRISLSRPCVTVLHSCPSAAIPCSSRTLTCRPSVLTPCLPSVAIPCFSQPIMCRQSIAIPCQSVVCPSLFCGPGPGPRPGPGSEYGGEYRGEYWYDEGALPDDPAAAWYGS